MLTTCNVLNIFVCYALFALNSSVKLHDVRHIIHVIYVCIYEKSIIQLTPPPPLIILQQSTTTPLSSKLKEQQYLYQS